MIRIKEINNESGEEVKYQVIVSGTLVRAEYSKGYKDRGVLENRVTIKSHVNPIEIDKLREIVGITKDDSFTPKYLSKCDKDDERFFNLHSRYDIKLYRKNDSPTTDGMDTYEDILPGAEVEVACTIGGGCLYPFMINVIKQGELQNPFED